MVVAPIHGGGGGGGGYQLFHNCLCRHIPVARHIPLRNGAFRLRPCHQTLRYPICISKSQLNDEQQYDPSDAKFARPVPSAPKFGFSDTDKARSLLESAFQALSFEMPRLPIESALQGLSAGVSRLSIPKQMFLFDITGFVATKLRKPSKPRDSEEEMEAMLEEKVQYPRCAWPRASQGAESERIFAVTRVQEEQQSNLAEFNANARWQPLNQSLQPGAMMYPHCKWPRQTILKERAEGSLHPAKDVLYPRSAWPRRGNSASSLMNAKNDCVQPISTKVEGVCAASNPQIACDDNVSFPSNGSFDPTESILEGNPAMKNSFQGGARCAWPRVPIPSSQRACSQTTADSTNKTDGALVSKPEEDLTEARNEQIELVKRSRAVNDTGVPRRMLATSVGFTLMDQLARSSLIETSPIDLLGLLPAASFVATEDSEAVAPELDRRTLLLFFTN